MPPPVEGPKPQKIPEVPKKNAAIALADLKAENFSLNAPIDFHFVRDLEGKRSGTMDPMTWNIYQILTRFYLSQGVRGEASWRKASQEANQLLPLLRSMSVTDSHGTQMDSSLQEYFLKLVRQKQVDCLRLLPDMTLQILNKKDEVLYSLNLIVLKRDGVLQTSTADRKSLLQDITKTAGASLEKIGKIPEVLATKVMEGIDFLDAFASPAERAFLPLKPPVISDTREKKTISVFDTLRVSRQPPKLVEDQFRSLDLCSFYAISLLQEAYGRPAVREMGLSRYGRMPNAWDLRATGIEYGSLETKASVANLLQDKDRRLRVTEKNPDGRKDGEGFGLVLDRKDEKEYQQQLGSFFELADSGQYPALVTIFNTDTKYGERIWNANKNRSENMRGYNSHVATVLGREPVRTLDVTKKERLGHFLEREAKTTPALQRYLKVTVTKTDGSVLPFSSAFDPKMKNVALKPGDKVSWQDVLVTDFFHGSERVMGLAEYASSKTMLLMDYMTLKNAEPRKNLEYQPVGFFQIEMGKPLVSEFQQKLGISPADTAYYFAAYSDLGIDLRNVRPKDMLPKFDLAALKKTVDAKGGPVALRMSIRQEYIHAYNESHPDALFIPIESGKDVWSHVSSYFEPYFRDRYALTRREKLEILQALDASCPNIDLSKNPPRFEKGDFLYLTRQRVQEIVDMIALSQAKQFNTLDVVDILDPGDSPRAFVARAFDDYVRAEGASALSFSPEDVKNSQHLLDISYDRLDSAEKAYVFRAFAALNPHLDLTLVDVPNPVKPGEVVSSGTHQEYKNLPVGDRMVFRRTDLAKCFSDIFELRQLRLANQRFSGPMTDPFANVRMGSRLLKIPENIRDFINESYPGSTLRETVVRNALYLVYAKEQMSGGLRGEAKDFLDSSGLRESQSIGAFQIRPTLQDMELCKDVFPRHGLIMPETFDEFKSAVRDNRQVAVLVAGQRLFEAMNVFEHFMELNGEDRLGILDENFAVMLITSYNRSPKRILRAVYQNWAYNLAEKAGVQPEFGLNEIDAFTKTADDQDTLEVKLLNTFRAVIVRLRDTGAIHIEGQDIDAALMNVVQKPTAFLQTPLYRELSRWYQTQDSRGLRFTFSPDELTRGDHIFSYGQRFIFPSNDPSLRQAMSNWQRSFRDYDRLAQLSRMVRDGKYELRKTPQDTPRVLEIPPFHVPKDTPDSPESLALQECRECLEDGHLFVYAKDVFLREKPSGNRTAQLFFGTRLKFVDVELRSGEKWAKVEVADGPSVGKTGYIAFEKRWYSNVDGPKLKDRFSQKLAEKESDPEAKLPADYRKTMERYLRFIANYNAEKIPHSLDLMARAKVEAVEVNDTLIREKIFTIARFYGYKNQKFFAVLPKVRVSGIPSQKLYLIDTENHRLLSMTTSTGRPAHETPSGHYVAYSHGYKDLNSLGADMGSYAQKYANEPERTQLQAGPGGGKISMTTALIEIRGEGDAKGGAGRYFHGTNRENQLGGKASSGCVRMANLDAVYLASLLGESNMEFQIIDSEIPPELASSLRNVRPPAVVTKVNYAPPGGPSLQPAQFPSVEPSQKSRPSESRPLRDKNGNVYKP